MTYKTVLVCLTNFDNAKRLTKIACDIARKFDAHLIGLHTLPAINVYPGISLPISSELNDTFAAEQKEEAAKIKKVFEKQTGKEDFVSEWRCVKSASHTIGSRLAGHARCADLVIMAQPDKEHDRVDQTNIQREVIEASGRPVLIVPNYGNFETIGNHVLVGWGATKEVSRAVHDALPFIKSAKETEIFWISKTEMEGTYIEDAAMEIAICMDRHGAKVKTSHKKETGLAIGDELLNKAADHGSDLIVSGAYGHSRMYDFMVGATTPHLMRHMTVPVLFSC